MDILKLSLAWAEDEVFSSRFFVLFGLVSVLAAYGFSQFGKTAFAKAFIIPSLVCGMLLMIIGIGLSYTNYTRIKSFPKMYAKSTNDFVISELSRAEKTMKEFELVVFKVIPFIIAICALIFIYTHHPLIRAISLSVMAMMIVILLVDTHSYTRIKDYKAQLVKWTQKPWHYCSSNFNTIERVWRVIEYFNGFTWLKSNRFFGIRRITSIGFYDSSFLSNIFW